MEFKVRLFLGGKPLAPKDYDKVMISSVAVDRVVNCIYDLANAGDSKKKGN